MLDVGARTYLVIELDELHEREVLHVDLIVLRHDTTQTVKYVKES